MMNPIWFLSPVFRAKKLPLRGALRDGDDCSRDARRGRGECQLGVSQHPEREAGQLTDRLGRKRQSGREEPGPAERARPAEQGADAGRDSDRDETKHHDRRRHLTYERDRAAKIVSPPSFRARSMASSPTGIRATPARAKSGTTARTAPGSGLVRL